MYGCKTLPRLWHLPVLPFSCILNSDACLQWATGTQTAHGGRQCTFHDHAPSYTNFVMQLVIMETEAARAATQDILTMHYIPHDRSEELRNSAAQAAEAAAK